MNCPHRIPLGMLVVKFERKCISALLKVFKDIKQRMVMPKYDLIFGGYYKKDKIK